MQTPDLAAPLEPPSPPPPAPMTASPGNGNGAHPLAPDDNTQTSVRCANCGTKAAWRGPLTADMLARSFTRGVQADNGLPNCPRCGHGMTLVSVQPIEQAIATAQRELGAGEAHQPRIPGLYPTFDFASACQSILEQRDAVRRAQAVAESKHRDYSQAKKRADEAQATLSQLEDEIAESARDAAYERVKPTIVGGPCEWEQAHPGERCPVCRAESRVGTEESSHSDRLLLLVERAEAGTRPSAMELRALLACDAELYISKDEAEMIAARATPAEIVAILKWLVDCDSEPKPSVLGQAHIVDETFIDKCGVCHALIGGLSAIYGLDQFEPLLEFGIDCAPPIAAADDDDEMAPAALQQLLSKAGADVSVEDVAGWTSELREEAATWASEQIEAKAKDKPGHHTSVRWPEHVSRAHNGPEAPRARPRHATKAARQQAKQAQTKSETAGKGKARGAKGRRGKR
jgi:hypothetical protein